MRLYFLRHAHAEEGIGLDDFDRRLTDKGVHTAQTMAQLLATLQVAPTHIYSSPRIRAKQTSEIVASALGREIEIRDEVNFGFDLSAVRKLIQNDPDEVMFVGHEPSLSTTITSITGGRVQMKKGGLARIDLLHQPSLKGQLVWLITPKIVAGIEDE